MVSPPPTALELFSPATQSWFADAFQAPTQAQSAAWTAIADGQHTLVIAPTGSGKTLAAFLWAIDRLHHEPVPEPILRCRVLYVSPLKALAADVERNLRAPLVGIAHAAARLDLPIPRLRVGMRTGDTPARERRAFGVTPPDILITTPESLFLILTSQARAGLAGVSTVIIDEVHALAGTKRGAHLALSLERLDDLLPVPAQRIGLSATVRPPQVVADYLAGTRDLRDGGRPCVIVQPPSAKRLDLSVVVPLPDLTDPDAVPATDSAEAAAATDLDLTGDTAGRPGSASIWPHVEERIVDLVTARGVRTTLVFTNSRRGAERLAARLNEAWQRRLGVDLAEPGSVWPATISAQSGAAVGAPTVLAKAHHGSMSRHERTIIEEDLKSGRLPVVVATSSLELGIDMGSIDLVVQVSSPPSVASGLQRIGRAGHTVGATSRGVIFPTFRGDLLPATVIAERMRSGDIEIIATPSNPLDVLAQHIVAMTAMDDWALNDLYALVRRSAPWSTLGEATFRSVLDMLAGKYPSEEVAGLTPRLVWDRHADRLSGRPGAGLIAATSGGTIPDRGLYGVFLATGDAKGGKRVGELDEEMVYESRVGDTFTLGSSSWRIDDITPDRVLVSPAPGVASRLPFWKGDAIGRPAELGRAIGERARTLTGLLRRSGRDAVTADLRTRGLDSWAAENLTDYLAAQLAATTAVPDDRTIIVEHFTDEIGDRRVVVHSPFGARVNAPWALLITGQLTSALGIGVQAAHSDDGIVFRLPDDAEAPAGSFAERIVVEPEDVTAMVTDQLAGSAMFAAKFREAAGRSLLLPRRRPGRRQPLWQQRQRAAQLLEATAAFEGFPLIHEAIRECLQDAFDVSALVDVMRAVHERTISIVEVETQAPSPFAQSLLFGYVAQFLYEGDTPLAERRAAALTVDPTLLAELLGSSGPTDLADLLVPEVVALTEAERQCRTTDRWARTAEELVDVLRRLGPLDHGELTERATGPVEEWLGDLVKAGRLIAVRLTGRTVWAVTEDAGRLRDGLGVALPPGLPIALTEPVPDPVRDLVLRHARTHGPFTVDDLIERFGLPPVVLRQTLARLENDRKIVSGRIRPPGTAGTRPARTSEVDYCELDMLRVLRRRSLAALRKDVEPSGPAALAMFVQEWQHVGSDTPATVEQLARIIEQLAGVRAPASAWESLIFPARMPGYAPALLDELTTSGAVAWVGAGALPGRDGWITFHPADTADLTTPEPLPLPDTSLHAVLADTLRRGGAFFAGQLFNTVRSQLTEDVSDSALIDALWDLVWTGHATNDSFAAVRGRLASGAGTHRSAPRPARPRLRLGPLSTLRPAVGIDSAVHRSAVQGRWSAAPAPTDAVDLRSHANALVLLDRYGVLTRGAVAGEHAIGGFGGVYRLLSALEESGAIRRGYFVDGLGGSQFAMPGAVDRLRELDRELAVRAGRHPSAREDGTIRVLAATDPASPFGAALPWPNPSGGTSHRPGRKAGAVVVLVDGVLVFYLERGAHSLLTMVANPDLRAAPACTDSGPPAPELIEPMPLVGLAHVDSINDYCWFLEVAARGLVDAIDAGRVGTVSIHRVDGEPSLQAAPIRTPTVTALLAAGFLPSPRGLRKRGNRAGR